MKLHEYILGPDDIGLRPGVYKFDGMGDFAGHRFHLRVDSERKGVLLVDASKLVFLNGTGLEYVWKLLDGKSASHTYRYMKYQYKEVDKEVSYKHYAQIKSQLYEFLHGNPNVLKTVGSENRSIGADALPAPYRMDIALTYRCENDCGHCYNETKEKGLLSPEQWEGVIVKLWDLGIPHIVFTGGEPTLYQGLESLITKSEECGQITGMITNGRSLREPGYLNRLVKIGLDHVQITVLSHRLSVHDEMSGCEGAWKETIEGLKVALKEDLYVSTNTTILRKNLGDAEETMRFLISLGVKNIAFNGIIRSGKGEAAEGISMEELRTILEKIRALAAESGINMIWYSPTPYCEFNPVNAGFGIKQCTACSINMAIEPDGTVLPCQSYYHSLGNIMTDRWESIWNNRLCKDIRERKYADGRCDGCDLLQVCGGGCPLSREKGDYVCLDRHSSM